ncbi:hypothetical protein GLOIN_2v1695891 [Rhizophagus clarus]|uniref:Uncharacterized protein n=1 Tax=Rhizophagus clarus TaxID=94130 RepID=A0A8H3MEL8_9GLOM|nr:hypothetical protein GLOIN_2v1695891 [Rhizophagus clarus]
MFGNNKSLDHDDHDESSIQFFLENLFGSDPEPSPSQVSSEIGKKIVELSKEETLEPSSHSCVSRLFSRVAFRASQLAVTVLSPFAAPRLLPSSAITSVYLLSAAGTSLAVLAVSIGGIVYYYETKNIPCKRCKRSMGGSEGCIEKCDKCKKEWEEDGCDTGYECCKEKEEKPGSRAREKCIICQETAIELKTKGCTQYCAKCKETCNTPGCDPSFKHDVIMD